VGKRALERREESQDCETVGSPFLDDVARRRHSTFCLFSLNQRPQKKKKKLTSAAADPKVVVDGTYGLTTPSSIPVFGKLLAQPAPNLAAKLASLRSSLNTSQPPRLLPNVSGILAAKRANNATQADLGLKQNVRRAEGEVLNSLAGFADRLRTKGDAIMTW
jgi:hypothetical protein